jgi:branched-chain amino acid aminotransferase
MHYYKYNGKILETGTPAIGPDNRGLRYGDGLFETLKFHNGSLILVDEHFARLWKGMQLLQFDIPKLFTPDLLQQQVTGLLKKNGHTNARVRITVIRGDGGLYDAKNNPGYLIQSWPLLQDTGTLNENGLHTGIFRDGGKMADQFANCKHNNYLPYFMGALFAKNNKLNDAIILNNHGRICDSTIANIFLLKNDIVFTPALSEGCVAGVLRKFILQTLPGHGIEIQEEAIAEEMLLDADEVFLTNSIYNMRWIAAIENKTFSNLKTKEIFNLLCQTNPAVFC